MREDRDSLVERLHRQTAEYSAFKLENERLKVCSEARGWDSWDGREARPMAGPSCSGPRDDHEGLQRAWRAQHD